MKPHLRNKDSAFAIMAMDILNIVLSHSDNPGEFGKYLTDEKTGILYSVGFDGKPGTKDDITLEEQ